MKKMFLAVLAGMTFGAIHCPAQIPVQTDDLPSGPWVPANAADVAHWTIDYRYPDAGTRVKARNETAQRVAAMAKADPAYAKMLAANPGMMLAIDPPRPLQVSITRTKNLRQQKIVYEGNLTGESWNDGIAEIALLPGSQRITVDLLGNDPATNDFHEFSWLARGNFQSRKKVGSQDCLIFTQRAAALSVINPRLYRNLKSADPSNEQVNTMVPITAIVDVATKLPLSLQVGDEVHVYTFLPPKPEMLAMTTEFAQAAEQAEAQYRAAHKPRPLP